MKVCLNIVFQHLHAKSMLMGSAYFQGKQWSMTSLRSSWKLKDLSSVTSSKSTGHTHRMEIFRRNYDSLHVHSLQSLKRRYKNLCEHIRTLLSEVQRKGVRHYQEVLVIKFLPHLLSNFLTASVSGHCCPSGAEQKETCSSKKEIFLCSNSELIKG